ncbi:MAG: MBOAT family protein [Bacteroidia bacterium]|nr:MBOAT family protein [Bacteroidia bacterium]
MVFSSPVFLFLFLPLVLLLNFAMPVKGRNALLMVFSLLFYAWGGVSFSLILIGSIGMNYGFGRWIEAKAGTPASKKILAVAITLNLILLGIFKYTNFFVANYLEVVSILGGMPPQWKKIVLPIGISFFTFQAISYLVDLYRREVPVQKSFIDLALYISLFPQLIAGPIVRYHDLDQQLKGRSLNLDKFSSGIERFIIGLGKKVLLANTFAFPAKEIFELNPADLSTEMAWFGAVCFFFQIYFDFSGYSDMAIGLGRMLGFEFSENFNYPYLATSIREFWQRWHISLSNWFRDYLYIPLGGNRKSAGRVYLNLALVFLATGLWHGPNWNFVIWGMIHGFFMVLERVGWGKILARLGRPVGMLYTWSIVLVTWVFFKLEDLGHAWAYLQSMFGFAQSEGGWAEVTFYLDTEFTLCLAIGLIGSLGFFPWLQKGCSSLLRGNSQSPAPLWQNLMGGLFLVGLAAILLLSAMYVSADTYNPFIYYRF